MREIEFRAFYDGKMYYGVGVTPGTVIFYKDMGQKMCAPIEEAIVGNECDGLFVMQFTGLHDKNGKEIYEGDIVEFAAANSAVGGHKRKMQVEWDDYLLCWSFGSKGYIGNFYEEEANSIEVIGNIHENPDLLEK
jgi:uncharacterized phage protein (TIGR01671 family)